jgi:Na+/H+ antiporter NhaD/arsenite permease-like protein
LIVDETFMSFDSSVTVAVVVGLFSALVCTGISTDLLLLAALTVLFALGVVDLKDALTGFSNEGVLTVGVLYIVVAGVQESGGIGLFAPYLFGRPKNLRAAQLRMMSATALVSAFLNNTAVVAMLLPAVSDWAKKLRISPSKLMIPLSYAAIYANGVQRTKMALKVHGWVSSLLQARSSRTRGTNSTAESGFITGRANQRLRCSLVRPC